MAEKTNIFGENLTKLINSLGLSDHDFALLCDISRATLVKLKSGKSIGSPTTLNKISSFTHIPLIDLNDSRFEPSRNLREKLIIYYKNDLSKSIILSKPPTIPYILLNEVLNTTFLDQYRERHEILSFIEKKLGYSIEPNTLTKSLNRMEEKILREPARGKNKGYQYKRK